MTDEPKDQNDHPDTRQDTPQSSDTSSSDQPAGPIGDQTAKVEGTSDENLTVAQASEDTSGDIDSESPDADGLNEAFWLQILTSEVETDRHLEAVTHLGQAQKPSLDALTLLESVAISHDQETVRLAALAQLSATPFRDLQKRRNQLPMHIRRFILKEIDQWQGDSLLNDKLATILRQRYNFDFAPTKETPQEPKEEKPPRTLAEILLGETAIKTALYLGAFFIISAACFFATVVEELRLPILTIATLGFLGGAIGVKRRLPQASFIFAIIFSFLIAIDGIVLQLLYPAIEENSIIFWTGLTFLLGLIWFGGTWFYQSRIFSVLSVLGFCAAAFGLARWFDTELHLDIAFIALPTLTSLGGVVVLRRWQDKPFSLPVFLTAQCLQFLLLASSVIVIAFEGVFDDSTAGIWWVVIGLTWLLAVIFYVSSERLMPWTVFRIMAVIALLPVPFLLLNGLSIGIRGWLLIGWLWAAVLAAGSEIGYRLNRFRLPQYALFLLSASALIFATVGVVAVDEAAWMGIAYFSGAALVFFALTYLRPRSWVFAGSLIAATCAYFAIFALPMFAELDGFVGFVSVWPPLLLLSSYLLARHRFNLSSAWYWPLLIVGLTFGALNLIVTITADSPDLLRAAIIFFLWAMFAVVFSLMERRPVLGYSATTSFAISLLFVLRYLDSDTWVLPLVGLAAVYYVGGFALSYRFGRIAWLDVLRWSGLGLGVLAALSAPFQEGASSIVGVAIIALFFTIEAFSRRNVWFGVPANVLYLMAYFMALLELDVSQPQYYSIGAALIGIVMHYFLIGSGSKWGAFIAGLLSQLILLGTTYIQMVSTERLTFFTVLFFQALVLLAYGLVVRSRSFFIVPICFLVLGVISLTFTVLAGVPTIILIGCTGFILLGLGILALVMRERLVELTDQIGEKLGGWQA
ncbi:MAG: hypothetical protein AAF629_16515 [Chloroflexota bacterium]